VRDAAIALPRSVSQRQPHLWPTWRSQRDAITHSPSSLARSAGRTRLAAWSSWRSG